MRTAEVQKSGFSLVELVIVIVIIGVIAAIAMPRFSSAANQAELATLHSNLAAVRRTIELYAAQHDGRGPNVRQNGTLSNSSNNFAQRLTETTNAKGAKKGDLGPLGPYLRAIPNNPFATNNPEKVRIGGAPAGANTDGWHFDPVTNRFSADDSPAHAAF